VGLFASLKTKLEFEIKTQLKFCRDKVSNPPASEAIKMKNLVAETSKTKLSQPHIIIPSFNILDSARL